MKNRILKAGAALISTVLVTLGLGSCSIVSHPKVYGPPPSDYSTQGDSIGESMTVPETPADSTKK